jgi:hypothetical protein
MLVGLNGLPALLIWIHVGDIFVHGPSKDKLMGGLKFIMDSVVRLYLICKPIKTSPPCQDPEVLFFCTPPPLYRAPECLRKSYHEQELW